MSNLKPMNLNKGGGSGSTIRKSNSFRIDATGARVQILDSEASTSSKGINKTPSVSKSMRKGSGLLSGAVCWRPLTTSSIQNQSRITEMQNYVVNKIEQMKKSQATQKKLTHLAAFIPDFILKEETSRKVPYQRSSEAVVFMVDVSGFTALTEAYSLKGKGGTDQLTKTLMSFIGPLAETILLCDGDIVKYAGDAFLAFWATSPAAYPEDVQRAIDCALYIQEKYGSYLCKEVDITIRVKIGIGAGIVHLCGIGNDNYQHYVCFGPGVAAASNAEKHCTSGEVVVHSSTWSYCNPSNYRSSWRDDNFRVVTQILSFINPEKRGRPQRSTAQKSAENKSTTRVAGDESIRIRPVIAEFIESKSEDFMRRFILPPVLRTLDDDIPLEYLNESRIVCISFIHIDTTPSDLPELQARDTMVQIVNKCFVKIYTSVTRMQGALTKVIMFDKGLTYLVVFGLPGYVNEHQCVHALKFSHSARRNLLGIRGVEEVSIGVTTGACYSGVLGHPRRQEYTVMGRKVNKAARLMCYYPGRVACDQDTAYHSKLPTSNFELQEYKELKGIANPGKIFEFINYEAQEDNSVSSFGYPVVGRDAEFRFFRDILLKTQSELNEHTRSTAHVKGTTLTKENVVSRGMWMVIFEGETGIGKSRMLAACMAEAERQNVQVFSVAMNLMMAGQNLFGLSSLIMDAIGIGGYRTSQEREDYLRKKVVEPDLAAELCVVNDILRTKFPMNPKYANLDSNAVQAHGQQVLSAILKVFYPSDLIMFAIDDAHFLDLPSWDYLLSMCKTPHIFCLMTLRRNATGVTKIPKSVSDQIYHSRSIKVLRLNGMELSHCLTLACQMLEVAGIPAELEKLLQAKSQGVPAWIDQVIHELVRQGVLHFSSLAKKTPMSYVDKKFLKKSFDSKKKAHGQAWASEDDLLSSRNSSKINLKLIPTESNFPINSSVSLRLTLPAIEETDPLTRLLVVKSGTNFDTIQLHGTLHEILLDSYDELNSNEQIILKCASVLGRKFSRLMVCRILPFFELNAHKYDAGFNRLMETRYIQCSSPGLHSKSTTNNSMPQCFCKDTSDSLLHNIGDASSKGNKRPKYLSCKYMEFGKDALAEVVYDLMTEDQRKDFHLKAAKYLDSVEVKCESCGGHNSAFIYGIVIKSNDLGLMDGEDSLRVAANSMRNGHHRGVSFSQMKNGRRRASLTTQIAGMKKRFQNDGSKIAQIEYEVLALLRKIDLQEGKIMHCCKKHMSEDEVAERELNEELLLLRHSQDIAIVNLKQSGDGLSAITATGSDHRSSAAHVAGEQVSNSGDNVDLRLCECGILQAKVCIAKVKHYREAKKYGKCMTNLLGAAELVITVGNGTQGLLLLEEAMTLLRTIQKGEAQRPDKDNQDDIKLDDAEVEGNIEYLNGLAFYEIGVFVKSKECFLHALSGLGLKLTMDKDNKMIKESSLFRAKTQLLASRYFFCCVSRGAKSKAEDEAWTKKLRILNYLHSIFTQDRQLEMSLLISIWEVITSERYGDVMHDLIPAYCNIMATHTAMGNHKGAARYEKLSLNIIKEAFGTNEQLDPVGLLSTATLFHAIAYSRLCRGEIHKSSEAAYLGLRIAQIIHDNSLMVRLLPPLTMTLLLELRIPELVEAMQKLWYISEEEDDWTSTAIYYALCLDLLLRTAYPLETFVACESFVVNNDWTVENNLYRDFEVLFTIEASLALWYARYSIWEKSTKWLKSAEDHRPKLSTFLSVTAEMKLLECHLILLCHYLDTQRWEQYEQVKGAVKNLKKSITKSSIVAPVMKPRFLHLMAYYYKIRSHGVESEHLMKQAEKLAKSMNNQLEMHWITHNRTVWRNQAIPTVKFFWLDHTENHVLDWHTSGRAPWANIMFSLPLPSNRK